MISTLSIYPTLQFYHSKNALVYNISSVSLYYTIVFILERPKIVCFNLIQTINKVTTTLLFYAENNERWKHWHTSHKPLLKTHTTQARCFSWSINYNINNLFVALTNFASSAKHCHTVCCVLIKVFIVITQWHVNINNS